MRMLWIKQEVWIIFYEAICLVKCFLNIFSVSYKMTNYPIQNIDNDPDDKYKIKIFNCNDNTNHCQEDKKLGFSGQLLSLFNRKIFDMADH